MKHKVKVTILDKKLYPELQQQYCADPNSGACPCYHVGDEYIFERNEERDSFWHMGLDTLVTSHSDADTTAGGPKIHIAPKPGMPSPAISTPAYKADRS